MKISSISVGLCQLVAGSSLICCYSRSLISLVVSLVFSPPSVGTETDPVVDGQRTNEQTNRSPPQSPVTGQAENWYGRLTVHILPATTDAGRPVTFCSPPQLSRPTDWRLFFSQGLDVNCCNCCSDWCQ